MNNSLSVAVVVVFVIAVFVLIMLKGRSTQAENKSNAPNIYPELRNKLLQSPRESLGIPAPPQPNAPWGVVMDFDVSNGTVTVFAASDGSASVYLSSGGGFIGGQGVAEINTAAKECVRIAPSFTAQMQKATKFDLPAPGEVNLFVLTDSGVLLGRAHESKLRDGTDPLSALANAAQDVITQYRLHGPKH